MRTKATRNAWYYKRQIVGYCVSCPNKVENKVRCKTCADKQVASQRIRRKQRERGEIRKMLCILAGNYLEAKRWAEGQLLEDDEWFFPADTDSLWNRKNFHVLVVGSAGQNVPPSYFERILAMAKYRGRIR